MHIQHFTTAVDSPEIGFLIEVSTMFYINYCVFTWWGICTVVVNINDLLNGAPFNSYFFLLKSFEISSSKDTGVTEFVLL